MTDRKEYIERGVLLDYFGADKEADLQPEVVMEFVESIPAADVVEVVRCRDCKKRYVPAYCALWYGQISDEHGCRDIFLRAYNDDFYCAYGERKDGAE